MKNGRSTLLSLLMSMPAQKMAATTIRPRMKESKVMGCLSIYKLEWGY